MSEITIKNISTTTVVLALPDMHFRREIVPGRTIPISKEVYDALIFDPGTNNLVNDHYIVFNGIAEEEQPAAPTPVVESAAIAEMLDKQDVTAFAKFIPNAAQAEREAVVQLAVAKGITTPAFVSLIKKYCDVDIIQSINLKHLAEEK